MATGEAISVGVLSERRHSLRQVAKLAGVDVSTAWRWALKGVRGIKLETVNIGARRFVRETDLAAFLNATNGTATASISPPATPGSEHEAARKLAAEKGLM